MRRPLHLYVFVAGRKAGGETGWADRQAGALTDIPELEKGLKKASNLTGGR